MTMQDLYIGVGMIIVWIFIIAFIIGLFWLLIYLIYRPYKKLMDKIWFLYSEIKELKKLIQEKQNVRKRKSI
jgi:hypothetical protein